MRLARGLVQLGLVPLVACASTGGRLGFVASRATQASWSFVAADHAGAAELLVDGRPRLDDCQRVRRQIRCELRGLWPGGHSVELHVAGASLKRTALVGHAWPERLVALAAHTAAEVRAAGDAGADAVLVEGEPAELVAAAHLAGLRALIAADTPGAAGTIERYGADGLVELPLPLDLARRFPEARSLPPPVVADSLAAAARAVGEGAPFVVTTSEAAPLLQARRRHAALHRGAREPFSGQAGQQGWRLSYKKERLLLVDNASDEPWALPCPWPRLAPLFGGRLEGDHLLVAPHSVALAVAAGVTPPAAGEF